MTDTGAPQISDEELLTAAARESIGSYAKYEDAQAAVDLLSDSGFPIEMTQIVGHDVRTVETVTGRMTKGRAALSGAAGGAWFGLFVALLIGIFTPGPFWFGLLLAGLVFGAAWGALLGFVQHWSTRGRRDFSSMQTLSASRYEVLVQRARAGEALRILHDATARTV